MEIGVSIWITNNIFTKRGKSPHHFRSADMLITNFHIPKSSLMLLVDAFLRDKGAKRNLIALYEEAIKEKYAFYSFGDSMLIL